MEKEAVRILEAAAQMYDVKVAIEKVGGAAGGSNSPALAAYLEEQAKKSGIFSRVVGACDFGASEDFSYFMERVQARGGLYDGGGRSGRRTSRFALYLR